MRSQIIALGLAGTAIASYAPPAYTPEVPTYEETTSAPTYEATSSYVAPPTYETPEVPSYGSSSSVETYPVETFPVHYPTKPAEYPTTTATVPHYPETTEYTEIPCESTTISYGPSTYTVSTKTTLTIPVTKPYETHPVYTPSTPVSPEKPTSYSVDIPVYPTSASWTTSPVAPYYPTHGSNATIPAGTGSPSASATKPPQYTGAASKAAAGAIVGFSGLLAALFL